MNESEMGRTKEERYNNYKNAARTHTQTHKELLCDKITVEVNVDVEITSRVILQLNCVEFE